MRFSWILWLLICSLLCGKDIEAKRDYKIILKKCDFKINRPKMLKYVNCSIGKVASNPERTFLSGGFTLAENISDFDVRISFYMLRKDNTRINLLTQDINGCQFLQDSYGHILLRNVIRELKRSSNLPRKCPIISNTLYTINCFELNEDDYPHFLPSLSFVFVTKFFINQIYEGDMVLKGRVKKIEKRTPGSIF